MLCRDGVLQGLVDPAALSAADGELYVLDAATGTVLTLAQVSDDDAIPEGLAPMPAAAEHTRAIGRELVGPHPHDVNKFATRSDCRLRVVRRDGKGLVATADLDLNRINVEIESEIVVESSSG